MQDKLEREINYLKVELSQFSLQKHYTKAELEYSVECNYQTLDKQTSRYISPVHVVLTSH